MLLHLLVDKNIQNDSINKEIVGWLYVVLEGACKNAQKGEEKDAFNVAVDGLPDGAAEGACEGALKNALNNRLKMQRKQFWSLKINKIKNRCWCFSYCWSCSTLSTMQVITSGAVD